MDKIVILPLVVSIILVSNYSLKKVFIYFFIPTLVMLPSYYQTKLVQGIPELMFWSAAFIPIVVVWALRDNFDGYHLDTIDIIIVAHLFLIFLGQFMNSNYKDAQKILFNDVMARLFPFILIKTLSIDRPTRIEILKSIVVVGAIVGVFMSIEFRLWYNVFDKPIP